MKPSIKDFFIKCDLIQELVTFTEEILNGKHFFGSEMCDEAVRMQLSLLEFVTDHLKNQEMCNETMHIDPLQKFFFPHCFKIQEMCISTAEADPSQLDDVSDNFKTHDICDDVVNGDSNSLQCVSDWVVMVELVKIWYDTDNYWNDDELVEWYNDYKQCK